MRTLLVLAACAAPLVAAPVPKALKKNPYPLAGEWVVVERYAGEGQTILADEIYWTIDGENLAVRGKRQEVPDGFMSNASRTITKPEGGATDAYDYTITPTDGTPTVRRPAVVELTGDRLTMCMTNSDNGPRPAECKPARGTITYVLQRVDAKAK